MKRGVVKIPEEGKGQNTTGGKGQSARRREGLEYLEKASVKVLEEERIVLTSRVL